MTERERREQDLQREIAAHLDEETDQQVEAGVPRRQAWASARRRFGNSTLVYEDTRAVWTRIALEQFLQDVRFALRVMRKSKAFTAAAVLTLAVAIGANTAMFSLVNTLLLAPLPYRQPERLVTVLRPGSGPISPADFVDLERQNHSFQQMAVACAWSGTITGGDHAELVPGLQVGDGMLPMLGVAPVIGRLPSPEEYQPGKNSVLVLSYGLWQRRFGGSPSVIGRKLIVNGAPLTVVGVMPKHFRFAPFWVTNAEMWSPLDYSRTIHNRAAAFLRVFGRLRDGVDLGEAQSEMSLRARQLAQEYPNTNAGMQVRVEWLRDKAVGQVRPALLVLFGAVGFVLLIACSNVAGLALARSAERQREIALRLSLGASRGRILRQLLTESVVLALLGGVVGLGLAQWGVEVARTLPPGGAIPSLDQVHLDGKVLALNALLSMAAGLLFGLLPALRSTRSELSGDLKRARRSSWTRNALVGAQVAMGLMLLAGAGLLVRSYLRLQAVDPGFSTQHILAMDLSLTGQQSLAGPAREAFYRRVLDRVTALPGVRGASMTNHLPITGDTWGTRVWVEGRPLPPPGQEANAVWRVARPGYVSTLGIALQEGRDFNPTDNAESPRVVIINRHLARQLWPGESPLGKRISTDDPSRAPSWATVVGVIRDVKQGHWTADAEGEVYVPFLQDRSFLSEVGAATASMTLVVRTAGDPAALAAPVRQAVWNENRDVAISGLHTMEQAISDALWLDRIQFLILSGFALFALALAAIGIYGVSAYAAARRAPEIAVRMALGAHRRSIRALILGQIARPVAVGVVSGWLGALLLSRFLSSLLYGVSARDSVTFITVPCILAVVALLAGYLPARRAAAIDPAVILRGE